MAGAVEADLLPGFVDPVGESHAAFRAVMQAMSRPALPVAFAPQVRAPAPMRPVVAAILLALADYDTPIWLDDALRGPAVTQFLSFHTGARIADAPDRAAFAVASGPGSMPSLAALGQGTPEYPDRSTTLIVQVEGLAEAGLQFEGPGIKSRVAISFPGMAPSFATEMVSNRGRFPCGVDLILAAPDAIAALPRSVRLVREA